MNSTAEAAKFVSNNDDCVAIVSHLAIEKYQLHCVARSIQDFKDNQTRFLVIGNFEPEIAEKNNSSSLKISKSNEERLKFWAGRKAAFPACGVLAPDYMCMDGSIPRGKLAEVLNEISRLSKKYNLPVANAFHAGDGNLHPLIMFDANDKESLRKCEEFGADILKYCVKVGGALTGEHGVGIEKRELMCEAFNDRDIQQQLTIKVALDPNSLLNPGKVYPILRKCAEEGRVHVHGGKTKFPDIPRF